MTWRLGPYRVDDRPFASGATAEVFAARRGRTGPRLAVKVLSLRTYRERAETEAQSGLVEHPRLMSVHEAVVDERRGVVGLVMDLAADGDLRTALRGSDAPSPIEMVQITDDVLAALEALHQHGLVHRDVKPENVLLERIDGQRRARLGDLGIARPVDRTRSTGSVLGTDLYIAPEVHDGGAPSIAADLWAVGYVLYEGLFGAPPHADAATTYQAIGRLRAAGPDRPPNVPDAMWRVVATLLAPSPADRPATATDARGLLASARPVAAAASASEPRTVSLSGAALKRPVYERSPRVTRAAAIGSIAAVVIGGLTFVGRPWAGNPSTGASSAIKPLLASSASVVTSDYQWRLHDGLLTGRFHVTNPSAVPIAATNVTELFPASAADDGRLALDGYDGEVRPQRDGSVLVNFAVPPLAAHAAHVVSFRLSVHDDGSDTSLLNRLVRDRDLAVNRYALTLHTTTTTTVPAPTTTTTTPAPTTTTAPATTTTTAKKRTSPKPTTTTTAPPETTTTLPEEVIV